MKLTADNLQRIRTRNHRSDWHLSIYNPRIVMKMQVNSSTLVRGDRVIPFDTVSSGSYLHVAADMVMLVGTTNGGSELGRIRVRSITSSQVTVAENNNIDWQDNLYLTVLNYIELFPIFPRIVKDPSNDENVIFYKDYDIAYTNQNSVLGSFVCMGENRAISIENGTGTSYWTSTGTYNVNGEALTYQWFFEGGHVTGSTAKDPANVYYTTPGHYATRLEVTNASGGVDTSYRYISVYNKPNEGDFLPVQKWEVSDLSGSRNSGGYTATLKVYQDISQIQPNALVVIFSDDYYGGTKYSPDNGIVFVGYILEESIEYDWNESSVEFQAGSISELMKVSEGFAISTESKMSPSTWFEVYNQTIQKAIYHYLRWHSTVLKISDYQYTGDDRFVEFFDSDRTSIYDAVARFLETGIVGSLVCDRRGKLWAEIRPDVIDDAPTVIPQVMTLNKSDWMDDIGIEERKVPVRSFVEMGGVYYSGADTDVSEPLLTNAPGDAPLYRGSPERIEGLILQGQDYLNAMSGDYLEHANCRFPSVSVNLAGNYRNLDIAPVEAIQMIVTQGDTTSGITFDEKFYITDMQWDYDETDAFARCNVNLHQITDGIDGITVVIPIPEEPPGFSTETPPVDFPPIIIPPFTTPTFDGLIIQVDSNTAYGKGLYYTTNLLESSTGTTWYQMNGNITGSLSVYNYIDNFWVTPDNAIYVISNISSLGGAEMWGGWFAGTGTVYSKLIVGNDISTFFSLATPPYQIMCSGIDDVGSSNKVALVVGRYYSWLNPNNEMYFFLGDLSGVSRSNPNPLSQIAVNGTTNMHFTNDSQWIYAALNGDVNSDRTRLVRTDALGTENLVKTVTGSMASFASPVITKIGETGNFLLYNEGSRVTKITGNGDGNSDLPVATEFTAYDFEDGSPLQLLASDASGNFLMLSASTVLNTNKEYLGYYRSRNAGTTWEEMTWFPSGTGGSGLCAFLNLGTPSTWVATNGRVYYTDDFGTNWYDKTGNLQNLIGDPTPYVRMVRKLY